MNEVMCLLYYCSVKVGVGKFVRSGGQDKAGSRVGQSRMGQGSHQHYRKRIKLTGIHIVYDSHNRWFGHLKTVRGCI